MIFKDLILKDFLTFKGANRIEFPDPGKHDTALVVILAPNFAGKTNVIRALEFLLYGKLRRNAPSSHLELVNRTYVQQAVENETLEAWVQATIITRGEARTFRRRIEVPPGRGSGRVKVTLEMTHHESRGDMFFADTGSLERTLANLVPECLFDYFYFQGETLANQLAEGGSKAIHEGLATLLHKDEWESAIANVEQVQRRIAADIQKIGAANREYTEKEADLGRIRQEIQRVQKELEQELETERAADEAFSRFEEQIKVLGRGTHHAKLNEALDKARRDLLAESRKLERIEAEMCELVGGSKGAPFFLGACAPALNLLEEMQKENLLPADTSEGFVERLLKADRCICGRPLSPAGQYAKERTCIEEYRARSMTVDLNAGLLTVLNMTETNTRGSLSKQVNAVASETGRLIEARMASIVRKRELEQTVSDLVETRAKSNVEEIAGLQAKQKQASERRATAARRQGDCEAKLKHLAFREKQTKDELERMVRGKAHRELKKCHTMQERANELLELVKSSLQMLMGSFRSSLQESLSRYYDQNTRDGTTAVLDQHLLPRVRDKEGNILRVLGGAQQQLLVLAHIISLAELRRSLHEQLDELGIKVGKLDDQSFFLDSIFAPCDPNMAGIVADFLPKRARQMVVLVAPQQWHENIQSRLEPAADKMYFCEYCTPKQPTSEKDFVVKVRKKTVTLCSILKHDVPSYTKLREIP